MAEATYQPPVYPNRFARIIKNLTPNGLSEAVCSNLSTGTRAEITGMYVITRDGVESLIRRLLDPVEAGGCRSELEKMLEIKEVLSWRADAGPCSAARVMSPGLFGEAQLLQAALDAFDKGSYQEAAALVSEFSHEAERNGSYRIW